jgi:hypothetical protein
MGAVALAYAKAGWTQGGVDLARNIRSIEAKALTLAEIAEISGETDVAAARTLLAEVEAVLMKEHTSKAAKSSTRPRPVADAMDQVVAWRAIVKAYARLGDWKRAELASENSQMSNGAGANVLMNELASAWESGTEAVRTTLRPLAVKVILQGLMDVRWSQVLPLVAAVEPAVVVTYITALESAAPSV